MNSIKLISFNWRRIVLMLLFVLLLGGAARPAQAQGTTYTLNDEASCLLLGGFWLWSSYACEFFSLSVGSGNTLNISVIEVHIQGLSNSGIINNDSSYLYLEDDVSKNYGVINNNSTLYVNATLNNNNGTFNNYGHIGIYGTFNNNGTFNNYCGGTISGGISGNPVEQKCDSVGDGMGANRIFLPLVAR